MFLHKTHLKFEKLKFLQIFLTFLYFDCYVLARILSQSDINMSKMVWKMNEICLKMNQIHWKYFFYSRNQIHDQILTLNCTNFLFSFCLFLPQILSLGLQNVRHIKTARNSKQINTHVNFIGLLIHQIISCFVSLRKWQRLPIRKGGRKILYFFVKAWGGGIRRWWILSRLIQQNSERWRRFFSFPWNIVLCGAWNYILEVWSSVRK